MAFFTSEITDYQVVRYGNSGTNVAAYIHCFNAGDRVVTLGFYNDGSGIPQNSQNVLTYPISAFDSMLNIMQSEKPLYYGFIDTSKTGYLKTGSEPVGEEEP